MTTSPQIVHKLRPTVSSDQTDEFEKPLRGKIFETQKKNEVSSVEELSKKVKSEETSKYNSLKNKKNYVSIDSDEIVNKPII